ncbi:unnamed protein product [Cylindrotheca closterium]|uniref:sn-1-specific diacylglycerol lipase n=1 Tax=Cylindrotheca closterium TaxID=2856 RepID=A0AAD2G9K9_9STRA|nr:unnamed protein product [Cylindrotheca closterium]
MPNSLFYIIPIVAIALTAWHFNKKEGEEMEEDPPEDSLGDVSRKIMTLLDTTKKKFGDKYFHVKLAVTLPALLQLINQAEASRSSDTKSPRDEIYSKAGKTATAKELDGLGGYLDFADWAYLASRDEIKKKLAGRGYSLLKHQEARESGQVGYFIATNADTKTALIGVKGTSSMIDVLTDCCSAAVVRKLDQSFDPQDESLKEIRAHEGILYSSLALAEDLKPFIKEFFLPLGYTLLLCGHSLGAGAASLTSVLLRSQHPPLMKKGNIKVVAFASPPVLDHKAAKACSSFITTIVNNSDCIPRTSLNNVQILLELLSGIQEKLVEAGFDPVDMKSTSAFFAKLREGAAGEMIMSSEEGLKLLKKAQTMVSHDDPDHLYIAGEVMLLYQKWQDRRKMSKGKEAESEEKAADEIVPEPKLPGYCVLTDGFAEPLSMIEISNEMVGDHLCGSHRIIIDSL